MNPIVAIFEYFAVCLFFHLWTDWISDCVPVPSPCLHVIYTSTRLLLQHNGCINLCTHENLWKSKEPTLCVWLGHKCWYLEPLSVWTRQKHQFWFGNKQRHSEPANPPGLYISLLRLSSPDAGSPRSHRRPRHCWSGPLLRLGSPGHPRRKRCKGLRRPGWGPCIPARRGPSRPPACTSARPGKIGPPWRWTDRGRVWRNGWRWKQRGGGVS